MSLLLDARKKTQLSQRSETSPSGFELNREEFPEMPTADGAPAPSSSAPLSRHSHSHDQTRAVGQNLFSAKFSSEQARISRSLLLALIVAVSLFATGAGYVWYVGSASDQPHQRIAPIPTASPVVPQPSVTAEAAPTKTPSPEIVAAKPAKPKRTVRTARKEPSPPPEPRESKPMLSEQREPESIDPLLNRAYLAYRKGSFDLAQQLYQEALRLDPRNTDALLGMAAIAQRRGADSVAAHYYAKVLELDPRDAVANAGMSALTTDDNRESRLKILLTEQQDSPALYFALANHFAAQQRWAEAQQAYFNAFKLDPQNAAVAFNLAVSLERLGQYGLAAQYYRTALQLDASRSEGFDHDRASGRIDELTR